MKFNILLCVLLLPFGMLNAQVSGIQRMMIQNAYETDTTIVRNYNDTVSVLMSYGHDNNSVSNYGLIDNCSFFIRDNSNGSLTHIVSLPVGYRVNDVRFVSLTRVSGGEDQYCCFCGTRYEYRDMYAMIDSNGNPSNMYYYVYDSIGFVGFFLMSEALSPNTTFTAKLRDVEQASQLQRMTCYAEYKGVYYVNQFDYYDNAVLDIIGVPNSNVNSKSAFWRVKFYPKVPTAFQPTGTRWDNNIRYDEPNQEIMEDVTQTDRYVVTASKKYGSDDQLWLRFSEKESSLVYGGQELNPYYHPLSFYTLTIADEQMTGHQYTIAETPRLCGVKREEFAVSFHWTNPNNGHEGLLTFRHDLTSGSNVPLKGLYDEGNYGLNDIVYVPEYDATATLQYRIGERTHVTDINYWSSAIGVYHMNKRLMTNAINLQSICRYNLGGDQLLWTGINAESESTPYLLYQRYLNPEEVTRSCQKIEIRYAISSEIEMGTAYRKFFIKTRFDDVWQDYDVRFISFSPYNVKKDDVCKEW